MCVFCICLELRVNSIIGTTGYLRSVFKDNKCMGWCVILYLKFSFRLENYQRVQAVHFAVEEINKDPQLLPNISLGFQIFDSCTVLQRAISGTLQLLSGNGHPLVNYRCNQDTHLAAVIGHSISTYTMLLAHILGLYRYPQVSAILISLSAPKKT